MDIAPLSPTTPPRAATRPTADAAAPEAKPAPAPGPNPRLRVDPALNLLVVEFRGADGEVTRSTPTEQELRAYRAAQLRGEDQTSRVMPLAPAPSSKPEAAPPAPAAEEASISFVSK